MRAGEPKCFSLAQTLMHPSRLLAAFMHIDVAVLPCQQCIHTQDAACELDKVQGQGQHSLKVAKTHEGFPADGLTAMDIAQHWLSKLTESHATQVRREKISHKHTDRCSVPPALTAANIYAFA